MQIVITQVNRIARRETNNDVDMDKEQDNEAEADKRRVERKGW